MTTVAEIQAERERREAFAAERAKKIEPGDYFALGSWVVNRNKPRVMYLCDTHMDAVRLLRAIPKS